MLPPKPKFSQVHSRPPKEEGGCERSEQTGGAIVYRMTPPGRLRRPPSPLRGEGLRPGPRQRPIAVLDLQHAERREVEAEMIGRRHVHDAAGADETLGLLDLVAHLGLVGAL